jgi:hypothetical protein
VASYVAITGDPVRTSKKRRLLAVCYRVHGASFLALVRLVFERNGSATNLLGILRSLPPADTEQPRRESLAEPAWSTPPDPRRTTAERPTSVESDDLLPGLI